MRMNETGEAARLQIYSHSGPSSAAEFDRGGEDTGAAMRIWLICTFALTVVANLHAEPLIFSATGCGPYKLEEEPLLEKYIQQVNADGKSEFLVHLGDIVSGSKKAWPESQYVKVADILKISKIPVLVVPGDNEWNDLDNPDQGWNFWTKHFTKFEQHFKNPPPLTRQQVRPENFAFEAKGVLVIGINLVGGRVHDMQEWKKRMQEDADWVAEWMNRSDKTRAAVVLAQAMPAATVEPFFAELAKHAKKYGRPVLYLHADGHVWTVEKGWKAANITRVQTDQVGRNPAVQVTVTDDAAQPFVFDRRLAKQP